ncbi:hypothetical protein; putative exported protein (plasmid) [Cupriavidus metallidurans CH34]|uniref:Uncharacterized protein n=1 Tax=Cupriavidus metallidurans (strain ATCC 43123 / DSM 2839 / NBRC 102507 / CH34) TaxID=266264 RepID=D3DY86_CUPMC|nr:hypothetical protein; putative exported protein [Cupriavidus metallidurans CH34]
MEVQWLSSATLATAAWAVANIGRAERWHAFSIREEQFLGVLDRLPRLDSSFFARAFQTR